MGAGPVARVVENLLQQEFAPPDLHKSEFQNLCRLFPGAWHQSRA